MNWVHPSCRPHSSPDFKCRPSVCQLYDEFVKQLCFYGYVIPESEEQQVRSQGIASWLDEAVGDFPSCSQPHQPTESYHGKLLYIGNNTVHVAHGTRQAEEHLSGVPGLPVDKFAKVGSETGQKSAGNGSQLTPCGNELEDAQSTDLMAPMSHNAPSGKCPYSQKIKNLTSGISESQHRAVPLVMNADNQFGRCTKVGATERTYTSFYDDPKNRYQQPHFTDCAEQSQASIIDKSQFGERSLSEADDSGRTQKGTKLTMKPQARGLRAV
jgi:hypothetical protein